MLAVGRRRGFETTVEPSTGSLVPISSSIIAIGTGSSGGGGSAEGIVGDIATDNTVTATALTGESFGAVGPTVLVFDDGRNATVGNTLSISGASGPEYGAWSQLTSGNGASGNSYWDSAQYRSRGKSARCTVASDGYGNFGRGVDLDFAARQEIFVSSWVRMTVNTGQIEGGRLKPWWLMDSAGSTGTDGLWDLVIPTRGGNFWSFGGNSIVAGDYDFFLGNIYPTANTWLRTSKWLKGDGGANCKLFHQALSSAGNNELALTLSQETFWQGLPEQFTDLNLWSYASPRSGATLYDSWEDDRYVATNPARVEIGDHINYSSCTDLRLCYVNSWAADEITFNIDPDFSLSGKYFHFHDSTNTHTNGGVGRLISA